MRNLFNIDMKSVEIPSMCSKMYVLNCMLYVLKVYSTSALLYIYYIFVYARSWFNMMHKIECGKCVTLHQILHVWKISILVYTHISHIYLE